MCTSYKGEGNTASSDRGAEDTCVTTRVDLCVVAHWHIRVIRARFEHKAETMRRELTHTHTHVRVMRQCHVRKHG